MDALKAISQRHSTRAFNGETLTQEALKRLVDAGRLAPTARNEQPWEFVVVTKKPQLRDIAALTDYGQFIADAGALIVVFTRDTTYFIEDGAAATENILIAATAMDIQSCWICGDKKLYCPTIAKMLNAPQGMRIVTLIAVGYNNDPPVPTPKRPLDEVLHWESF